MTQSVSEEPVDVAEVGDSPDVPPSYDDLYRAGCRYYIDPKTGYLSILSPPGTPPVTSEDVRKLLEDFP